MAPFGVSSSFLQETDYFAGALYNGYESLSEFYAEMSSILPCTKGESAMEYCKANNITRRRIPIPHLVLQALDDPLSTWRTNTADDPTSVLHPSNLFQVNAQENLVLLLTSTGGHVGWPVGWWPHSWVFMNDFVAAGFVVAWNEGLCVNASNIQ